jgi:hypothetical protein
MLFVRHLVGGLNVATIEPLVPLLTFIDNIDLNKSRKNLANNDMTMSALNNVIEECINHLAIEKEKGNATLTETDSKNLVNSIIL